MHNKNKTKTERYKEKTNYNHSDAIKVIRGTQDRYSIENGFHLNQERHGID